MQHNSRSYAQFGRVPAAHRSAGLGQGPTLHHRRCPASSTTGRRGSFPPRPSAPCTSPAIPASDAAGRVLPPGTVLPSVASSSVPPSSPGPLADPHLAEGLNPGTALPLAAACAVPLPSWRRGALRARGSGASRSRVSRGGARFGSACLWILRESHSG